MSYAASLSMDIVVCNVLRLRRSRARASILQVRKDNGPDVVAAMLWGLVPFINPLACVTKGGLSVWVHLCDCRCEERTLDDYSCLPNGSISDRDCGWFA